MSLRYLMIFPLLAVALQAQTPNPVVITRSRGFAPVGVATSETIQVNVANTAANSANATASCSGTISFNVQGSKAQPAAVKFTVTAGEIFSTDLEWANLGVSGRGEAVASIQSSQTAGVPCALSASVETYDTTSGVTHSFQGNPAAASPIAVNGGGTAAH